MSIDEVMTGEFQSMFMDSFMQEKNTSKNAKFIDEIARMIINKQPMQALNYLNVRNMLVKCFYRLSSALNNLSLLL